MNRKHFNALAQALRDCKPDDHSGVRGNEEGWALAVEAVTEVCQRANSLFSPKQFKIACGLVPA